MDFATLDSRWPIRPHALGSGAQEGKRKLETWRIPEFSVDHSEALIMHVQFNAWRCLLRSQFQLVLRPAHPLRQVFDIMRQVQRVQRQTEHGGQRRPPLGRAPL